MTCSHQTFINHCRACIVRRIAKLSPYRAQKIIDFEAENNGPAAAKELAQAVAAERMKA